MGYKKMDHRLGFAPVRSSGPTGQADLELQRSLEHNRSLKLMENLNAANDWSRIESVLMSHYTARPVKLVLHQRFIDTPIVPYTISVLISKIQRAFNGVRGSKFAKVSICCVLPSEHFDSVGIPKLNCFRDSISGPHFPLPTLRLLPYDNKRMTRARCDSLSLHHMKLSFTTFRRFIRLTNIQVLI